MTITVAGTYTSPDENPLSGWVALSLANPRAVHSTAPEFVASKRVVSELDETGSVSFEVTASDDPGWELGPVLYRVEEHLSQQEHLTWFGYLTEPVEGGGVRLEEVDRIADPELGYWPPAHIPVPGPPNVLTVDSTTTGDPGTDADVTISGTSPEQALAFTIPRGDQGDKGDKGDQGDTATVDAGTTTTGAAGTDAAVVNSGSPSAAVFDFTIPKGDQGDKGDKGDQGELTQAEMEAYAAQRATVGNLLTDNQASGTDTLGTTEGFTASASTITSDTTAPIDGTASLRVTAAVASPSYTRVLIGTTAPPGSATPTDGTIPVTPGSVITLRFDYIASAVFANPSVAYYFWTAGGAQISSQSSSLALMDTTLRTKELTFTVPATAAYMSFRIYAQAPAIGDYFRMDRLGVWTGAGGNWAMPGTPITGLGTRITRPNIDDRLVEQWNGSAWSVVDYDSGWRSVPYTSGTANWTGGDIFLRRVYNTVYFESFGAKMTTIAACYTLPLGYRIGSPATSPAFGIFRESAATGNPYWFGVGSSFPHYGGPLVGAFSPTDAFSGAVSYATNDPIPTNLPGTLVSPAPQ